MQNKLKKLSGLYDELLKNIKIMDAVTVWHVYNGIDVRGQIQEDNIYLPYRKKIINVQNEIDNLFCELSNECGIEFNKVLEKMIFLDKRK